MSAAEQILRARRLLAGVEKNHAPAVFTSERLPLETRERQGMRAAPDPGKASRLSALNHG